MHIVKNLLLRKHFSVMTIPYPPPMPRAGGGLAAPVRSTRFGGVIGRSLVAAVHLP